MIRSFMLLLYCSVMLLLILLASSKLKAEVLEPKQIHQLTTIKYVVKIECDKGSGSGVIVNGKVLTAAHVIMSSESCQVIDYKGKRYNVIDALVEDVRDLALLKVDNKLPVKGIRLSKYKKQKRYDSIYTIGFPIGLDYVITQGRFIDDSKEPFSLSNMPVIYGNSGGGVFVIEDKEIRLVGIVHSLSIVYNQIVPYLSYYTNVKNIKEFLNNEQSRFISSIF